MEAISLIYSDITIYEVGYLYKARLMVKVSPVLKFKSLQECNEAMVKFY